MVVLINMPFTDTPFQLLYGLGQRSPPPSGFVSDHELSQCFQRWSDFLLAVPYPKIVLHPTTAAAPPTRRRSIIREAIRGLDGDTGLLGQVFPL